MFLYAISRRRAAQQRADMRLGGALATFRCRPFFVSSAGQFRITEPSERLHFLLVRFLYASKENEQKNNLLRYYGLHFIYHPPTRIA
jgi:hypothetical protein